AARQARGHRERIDQRGRRRFDHRTVFERPDGAIGKLDPPLPTSRKHEAELTVMVIVVVTITGRLGVTLVVVRVRLVVTCVPRLGGSVESVSGDAVQSAGQSG